MSTKTERKPVFRRASSSSLGSANGDGESLLETSAAPSRSSSRPMTPSRAPPLQHTKSEPARRSSAPNRNTDGTEAMGGKLRQAAQRIQLIRNLSSTAHHSKLHGPHHDHSEPGLDAKKMDLDDEEEGSQQVDVVTCDISSERFEKYTRSGDGAFQDFLGEAKPNWSKIRWIHVNGMSWKVMKPLALKYDLHPLALEDALHGNTEARSKADYYPKHLFIKVISYALPKEDDEDDESSSGSGSSSDSEEEATTPKPRKRRVSNYFSRRRDSDRDLLGTAEAARQRRSSADEANPAVGRAREKALDKLGKKLHMSKEATRQVRDLTEEYRVKIKADHMSVFLLRDGTIISIMKSGAKMLAPIYSRLNTSETILREKEDASMLLQALLDLIVDNMRGVTEAYRDQLTQLEANVLANPNAETVRHLHILSADLLMLRRGLTPLQNVVYALRRYDQERSIVSRPQTAAPNVSTLTTEKVNPFSTGLFPPGSAGQQLNQSQQVGFLSMQSRVYLSDVHDHLDEVTSALELFSSLAENLVDYTFNMINFNMNESMRGLTIVTVVFLPLTVLTGYYGMNFETFGEVTGSISHFWKIAVPMVIGALLIFCGNKIIEELRRFKRTLKRSHRRHKRIAL